VQSGLRQRNGNVAEIDALVRLGTLCGCCAACPALAAVLVVGWGWASSAGSSASSAWCFSRRKHSALH
jgi:hypothetical protein